MTMTYQPGVCNIGPAERRQRRQLGWTGLVFVIIGLVCFTVFDAPTWIRFLIVIPAAIAANGFLQSAMHFCVGFSMRGLYNMSADDRDGGEHVMDKEMRRADQRKGLLILTYSILIAGAVVVIAVLLP